MYVSMFVAKGVPEKHQRILEIMETSCNLIKGRKGLVNAYYYSDEETNTYGDFTVWESKELYEASKADSPLKDVIKELPELLPETITYHQYELTSSC